MNEALKVDNLNKHFREPEDFHVLKDISFSVAKSEFVPIIGKSGSGKSTLLYLLSTLDTDYTGEIRINDELVTGQRQNDLAGSGIRISALYFSSIFYYLNLPHSKMLCCPH